MRYEDLKRYSLYDGNLMLVDMTGELPTAGWVRCNDLPPLIPVSERLPRKGQLVIVYFNQHPKTDHVVLGRYFPGIIGGTQYWEDDASGLRFRENPTHWREILW